LNKAINFTKGRCVKSDEEIFMATIFNAKSYPFYLACTVYFFGFNFVKAAANNALPLSPYF
jgi:hypothetical protein